LADYGTAMFVDRPARVAAAIAILLGVGVFVIVSHRDIWLALTAMVAAGSAATLAFFPDRSPAQAAPIVSPPPVGPHIFLDALADPALHLRDGRVAHANPAAVLLLGRHIIGADARLAIRHPSASPFLAVPGEDGVVEITGIGQRQQIWELRSASLDSAERIIQLIDRTARYAAERARVDFVANASHELRTPLSTILGFIETLGDEKAGGDPATRARFLGVMEGEARRMQGLIDDLISLSRIEAEKYELPTSTINFGALIKSVAGEFLNDQGRKREDINVSIESDLPPIAGDRAQLRQLVHNLLENAVKYGGSTAPVEVALKLKPRGQIELSVADRGEGVAPEHIPRLTERFYRVDPGRSRAGGGTGLGLSIVKHIVERHRGRLSISSVVGFGTTVSVIMGHVPVSRAEDGAVIKLKQI
jgi:two-component system, OmpR family, phosphate regulon sensor histidine kinase PhoR